MKIIYSLLMNLILLNADNFQEIALIQIDNPYVLKSYRNDEIAVAYCKKGNIDYFQNENIIKFFQFAREYDSYQAATYCYYPCRITGKVKLDSEIYDFELNEGGFAVLKRKDEERYFGDESRLYECGI